MLFLDSYSIIGFKLKYLSVYIRHITVITET